MRTLILTVLVSIGVYGQTCTILSQSNCGTSGFYAGPPTLHAFVSGAAASLSAMRSSVASVPQPRIVYSGEIVAASESFMVYDPKTCPNSGMCLFNNPAVIDNWIDSLVDPPPNGVGLTSVDLNLWPGPLLQSVEYNPSSVIAGGLNYCGAYGVCYGGSQDSDAAWHASGLATYDQMFAHLATKTGVKVRIAPMFTKDVMKACGIQAGAISELQMEQCAVPLWAAMVKRWHVDDATVIHEPCGVLANVLVTPGCALSVSDLDTFIQHAAAAVRAASQNVNIRIGAGALSAEASGSCPGVQNYWCDWYTNLAGVLDFFGLDIYPDTSVGSSGYATHLSVYPPLIAPVLALGKPVVANESSALRWSPLAPGLGEGGTYWGCAASEWFTDGTWQAWARAIPGAWAAANGLSMYSIFPTEPMMLFSSDPANNHCVTGDGYETNLSAALSNGALVSPAGRAFAVLAAGWNVSLQGNAHLTGSAHLGH